MQTRDLKLLEGIERHRYLRTDQAAELFFPSIKKPEQRLGKARERLLMLHRNKLVKRARYPSEPYIYFEKGNARSHKMNHYLTITDVLLQIRSLFPTGSVIDYDIELKHRDIITDLVIWYRNGFRKQEQTFYIEVELDSTGDLLEKVRKYEDADLPGVLIIVCKHRRQLEQIRTHDYIIPVLATTLDGIRELKLMEAIASS